MNIFGYLSHIEDCQRQPPPLHLNKMIRMTRQKQVHDSLYVLNGSSILPKKYSKPPNCYIIFCSFYKKILDKEFPNLSPQEKVVEAGKMWSFLPNELKNSFIKYADDCLKLLATSDTKPTCLN